MIKYPLDYNPVIEYYNKIQSGEIVASFKVKRVYQELVDRINNPDYEYYYSSKHANHAIEFMENFCVHSKDASRQPLKLMLWQKALVASTFGFIHKETQVRMVRELILIVARKNGKSALASGLSLYLLLADGEQSAEIVSAATSKEQARLTWKESVAMIKSSPTLAKRAKCLVNEIKVEATFSSYKPVSSEAGNLDGHNLSAVVLDELHSIKNINIYDVLVDSMTTRKQPLTIITTTSGFIEKESPYEKKYEEIENIINGYDLEDGYRDNRTLPIVYELDEEEEVHDEDCWIKANPAIDVVKSREELVRKYKKALSIPSNMRNLLCKDFNRRQSSVSAWLTYEQINNEATFDIEKLKPKYVISGCDLSSSGDLTSACISFMLPDDDTVYFEHMYWLPETLIEERAEQDGVPYELWVEKGLLRLSEGNTVHPKNVTEWFLEMQSKYNTYIYKCGFDAWSANYFVEDMENRFGKNVMVPVIQGKKTLSLPMQNLALQFEIKNINYNNNPITKWCILNTTVDVDKNGNIQPVKDRRRKRIDGLAAMLDAFVVLENNRNDYLNMIK